MSHAAMARLGWQRVDPKPWKKCGARWQRSSGEWQLEHCGHPTANYPWALYDKLGRMHVAYNGRAWTCLEEAALYVEELERGRQGARQIGPGRMQATEVVALPRVSR